MPLEVAWRLMFRVNDRVAADRCLARALGMLTASVCDKPKPYWKQPELWEVSLRSRFGLPAGESVLSLLAAASAMATGWSISGPLIADEQVSVFEGVFDARWGREHLAGLHWASFSVGVFPKEEQRVGEALVLRSARLSLRLLRMEDAAPITAYRSLPEVARFQSWESFGPDDAVRLVTDQSAVVPDTPDSWLQLALILSESATVIGDCGIHFLADDSQQVELGITLAPAYQGRGLATEALSAVLEYVFDRLGKHRVFAVTDAENHAARSLFRRLGFRHEAHFVEHLWFKGAWCSENVFALLRREWQAIRPENSDIAE